MGSNRRVVVTKRYEIKLPRVRHPGCGMRSNRWERELWRRWRPAFPAWKHLCPVLLADPFGLVVVMQGALPSDTPGIVDEAIEHDADCYPLPTVEFRAEEYGIASGQAVCFDYGLADADMVREKRAHYRQHSGR